MTTPAPPGRYSDMGIEKNVTILGKIGKLFDVCQPVLRELVAMSHDAFWVHADDMSVRLAFGRSPVLVCHSISEQMPERLEALKIL
jgi:hypothetical protein